MISKFTFASSGSSERRPLWINITVLSLLLLVGLLAYLAIQSKNSVASESTDKHRQWKLLLAEENTIHLHWLRTLNPFIGKTDGDLVWNSDLQKGLMRFVNLPKLKKDQFYHLWIFDLQEAQNEPISAAVFRPKTKTTNKFYALIQPVKQVKQPYKFLLTIGKKEDTSFSKSQSLLLAQP